MPYCPRCGVELDPSVTACPLCRTPIPRFPDLGPGEPAWPERGLAGDPAKAYLGPRRTRWRVFGILSAVLAAATAAVVAANLLLLGSLTWSLYAVSALGGAWGMTTAVFVWYRRPLVAVPVCFGVAAGALAALDAAGTTRWFAPLGFPLVVLLSAVLTGGWFLLRRARGYHLLGVAAGFLAVLLLGVDLVVEVWMGKPGLSWSLITGVVLVPLAGVFLFLHFGLRLSPDLKRTFHV
jgi:hypothetical protein